MEDEVVKPKGYMREHERKGCWNCFFQYDNRGTVPSQENADFCSFVSPNLQVSDNDICDEHQSK